MSGGAVISGNTAFRSGGGVYIFSDGIFTMKDSSKITGGQAAFGGGVYVADGSFTMSGTATLQGNKATEHGGGVHILSGGIFTMSGGTIGGDDANTAKYGGGVFVSGGTFDMNNGTISGNSTSGPGTSGGGVCISSGEFTMSGDAVISKNTAGSSGGGVFVSGSGKFTMEGGTIGGSEAGTDNFAQYGGGVYVNGGEFEMTGTAILQGNEAADHGGGVYIHNGTFTMSGRTISGNKAAQNGGGVYVGDGTFTMTGGTISAYNASVTGGGVYVSSTGSFTLGPSSAGSSPVISGNTGRDTSHNNVYLYNGKTLSITGKLQKTEDSGNIGISMDTPGVFTLGWGNSGSTDTAFFFSDDRERNVALSGSELSLNLVRVEGGSCTLNGTEVTLSSFWISSYEVTQEEFESVMTGNHNDIAPNPSHFQGEERPPAAGEVQERRPVENVRWYDAIVYCNLLSIKEGLTPCYTINGSTVPADWRERPVSDVHDNYNGWNSVTCNFDADGYRLPTEAEWEYAARGGNPKDSSWNNTYSGSDTLEDVAWYSNNSDSKTHEVGKKQANALGLYDMSGNLKEWCWNRKSEDNDSRVMRGGYYSSGEDGCQVTAVDSNFPISQGPDQGFRVVRSAR